MNSTHNNVWCVCNYTLNWKVITIQFLLKYILECLFLLSEDCVLRYWIQLIHIVLVSLIHSETYSLCVQNNIYYRKIFMFVLLNIFFNFFLYVAFMFFVLNSFLYSSCLQTILCFFFIIQIYFCFFFFNFRFFNICLQRVVFEKWGFFV